MIAACITYHTGNRVPDPNSTERAILAGLLLNGQTPWCGLASVATDLGKRRAVARLREYRLVEEIDYHGVDVIRLTPRGYDAAWRLDQGLA